MSAPRPVPLGAKGVEDLLPPGAGAVGNAAPGGPQRPGSAPLPVSGAATSRPQPVAGGSQFGIRTEDGSIVTLREPIKTVGYGDDAIELRSKSPEERARWRLKKNLIIWGFGLIVLVIAFAMLLLMGPL